MWSGVIIGFFLLLEITIYSMSGITSNSLYYCYYVVSRSNSLKKGGNFTWLQDS